MKYILIIWIGSNAVATAEFNNLDACQEAKEQFSTVTFPFRNGVCVPKGE